MRDLPIVSIIYLIFLLFAINHVQSSLDYENCTVTNDTFAPGSTFHENLKIVLHNLTFAASTTDSSFCNSSFGEKTEAVYGLYLCRGDLNARNCSSCIVNVTRRITEECPNNMESIVWEKECMIRYANRNIFSKEEELPAQPYVKSAAFKLPKNATLPPPAPHPFNQTEVVLDLIDTTAFGDASTPPFFATNQVDTGLWAAEKFYSLAQCTPDISQTLCHKCLSQAYTLIKGGTDSIAYLPSCYLRWGIQSFFYNTSKTTLLSPSPLNSSLPPASSPPHGETATGKKEKKQRGTSYIPIAIALPSAVALLLLCGFCLLIRKSNTRPASSNEIITTEVFQYDIGTIKEGTKKFSSDNKLGQGGFGTTYKGTLQNGEEIAVKRLLPNSRQGIQEFKNEAVRVAKLQHRNLVRVLGYCVAEEEKLLIYEFLPNSSLDQILSDPNKRKSLAWDTRYKIIEGMARGLLYLHEYSQYKIVHQDLKPSNILLDKDMIPKISNFGMATLFGEDQVQSISSRANKAQAYMAPEYIKSNQVSAKSDVYSFGAIILEIVTGQRLTHSLDGAPQPEEGLLQRAWRHWDAKDPLALIDPTVKDNFSAEEVTKCIHIGLSCVQEDAEKRPTIGSVVSLLNSHSNNLSEPTPSEGYSKSDNSISSSGQHQSTTISLFTGAHDITVLTAR